MRLSVVIPCYNAVSILELQLKALTKQHCPENWEIVISDNGLNVQLNELVQKYQKLFDQISIVDAKGKNGPSYARNRGALHARGRDLLFVDADDLVGENYIEEICNALDKHQCVASKLDFSKLNPDRIAKVRGLDQDHKLLKFGVVSFLPYAVTSGLGIRKNLHQEIGGFDETLLAAEDAEYCWRVQISGEEIFFAEKAILHYRFRENLIESFRQALKYGEYDVFLYKKYCKIIQNKPNKKKELKDWIKLLRNIKKINSMEKKEIWLRSFAKKIGRLKGSVKYRIFVP